MKQLDKPRNKNISVASVNKDMCGNYKEKGHWKNACSALN